MHKAEDFLVEIGTEELPPQDLQLLSSSLANSIQQALNEQSLTFTKEKVKIFATPRRLAVLIPQLSTQQPEQLITKRGPAINAAYNADGSPTKAALGFAESCGVDIKQLSVQETDKGQWLYFEQKASGKMSIDLLPAIVENALQQLPIKKRMRWGAGENSFVRPMHWILMLLGDNIVPANIWGIQSNNLTYGHRIHNPKPIKIELPELYEDKLEQEGFVIASFAKRQTIIADEIASLATSQNGTAVLDQNLLDLVTGLVEFPVALLASFDATFLNVPKECLISAMQDHQKCFALLDKEGKLMPKFILISNLKSTDPDTVIRGNELVMHARLADAQFHYNNDLKHTLESRVEKLKTIIYQKKLGSLHDKVTRIGQLATYIASNWPTDPLKIKRAADLCKADLLTNMVYEFPELQGIMGYYYALNDKEADDVAIALEEYYKPRTAIDNLPNNQYALALALADRIDSLVGFFGIGLIPTGEKDPYALRRQALAVIRILVDKKINLILEDVIKHAISLYPAGLFDAANSLKTATELLLFFSERMKGWVTSNNISPQVYVAVQKVIDNKNMYDPLDIFNRINAVVAFQKSPQAENLTAANKRVRNFFNNPTQINAHDTAVDSALLSVPEEIILFEEINKKETETKPMQDEKNYSAILQALTSLQQPTDKFFEKVMVNVEDVDIKQNRLRLLNRLRKLFNGVADISLL